MDLSVVIFFYTCIKNLYVKDNRISQTEIPRRSYSGLNLGHMPLINLDCGVVYFNEQLRRLRDYCNMI